MIFGSNPSSLFAQHNRFIQDFVERLENSKKYILLVAETIPEDSYGYKATPESLSFAENLLHIGYALDSRSQFLLEVCTSREWKTDTVF